MIKHIVMWNFKEHAEGKSRRENMEIVRDALYALTSEVEEIKSMEIGFDLSGTDASADICLVTEFESLDTLKVYAEHPKHLDVAVYVRRVAESRKVIDYEI